MAGDGDTTLIADVLIDGTGAPALIDPEIVIGFGRVLRVGRRSRSSPSDHQGVVLDYRGCSIGPGLIDSGVHLNDLPCSSDDPWSASASASLLKARFRAQDELLAGVTTVRAGGDGGDDVLLRLREGQRLGLWPGPRLLLSGEAIAPANPWLHGADPGMGRIVEVRKAVRRQCERGFDSISLTVGAEDPSLPHLTVRELQEAAREAHRLNRTVVARVSGPVGMAAALHAAVDLIHCAPIPCDSEWDGEPARRLPVSGTVCSLGLVAMGKLPAWTKAYRSLRAAGATVAVHGDARPPGNDLGLLGPNLELMVRGALASLPEAVGAASHVPAHALGLDDEVGSLQAGRRADLIVVDGDLSRDAAALRRVRMVMIGGEPVVEEGWIRPPSPDPIDLRRWAGDA